MATEPAPARPYSLRRRLIWLIVATSTVLWLASLSIMTVIAWRETNDVFDDALEESGYLILAATTDWNERSLSAPRAPGADQRRKVDLQYQIVAGARVLQRTAAAPSMPFVASFDDDHGFEDVEAAGKHWRVFVARSSQGSFEVQVGQQAKERLDILEEMAEQLWLPMLSLLAVLGAASWLLIGRIMQPIERTARAITQKSPHDLARVDSAGQPAELVPVVDALNGVLARLDSALQAERRFTADAAHELRTPLAAVHMHIQLVQRQHPELAPSFARLRGDIERSTALVDSLLTLARLDPASSERLAREPVALAPLCAQVLGDFTTAVRGDCAAVSVLGHPDMLRVVLRNLIDNALRYGGAGCTVQVSAHAYQGGVRLAVRDDGPGVAPLDRARLAERFFRVLGTGQSGSGLGLSIVGRIATLHGAALHFEDGLGGRGLGVVIDFPAPALS